MDFDRWSYLILDAVAGAGGEIDPVHWMILREPFTGTTVQLNLIRSFVDPVLFEILRRGSLGERFGEATEWPPTATPEMQCVLGQGSATFRQLHAAFFSFCAEFRQVEGEPATVQQKLLLNVMTAYRRIFFPGRLLHTPVPFRQYAGLQQQFLRSARVGLDSEDFLRGNPLLLQPSPARGAALVLVLQISAAVAGLGAVWHLWRAVFCG